MSCGDEYCACFIGKMELRFGNFACYINLCACVNRLLKIALCAARTPRNAVQAALRIACNNGFAPQNVFHVRQQFGQGVLLGWQRADVEQILFAKLCIQRPAQFLRQLCVVAQLWVCV